MYHSFLEGAAILLLVLVGIWTLFQPVYAASRIRLWIHEIEVIAVLYVLVLAAATDVSAYKLYLWASKGLAPSGDSREAMLFTVAGWIVYLLVLAANRHLEREEKPRIGMVSSFGRRVFAQDYTSQSKPFGWLIRVLCLQTFRDGFRLTEIKVRTDSGEMFQCSLVVKATNLLGCLDFDEVASGIVSRFRDAARRALGSITDTADMLRAIESFKDGDRSELTIEVQKPRYFRLDRPEDALTFYWVRGGDGDPNHKVECHLWADNSGEALESTKANLTSRGIATEGLVWVTDYSPRRKGVCRWK